MDEQRKLLREAVKIIHAGQRNLNKDWLMRAREALRQPKVVAACSVCGDTPAVQVSGTYYLCGPCVLERLEPNAPGTPARTPKA